jgi:hypothetical protein
VLLGVVTGMPVEVLVAAVRHVGERHTRRAIVHVNPRIKDRRSPVTPPGERSSARLAVLDQGANVLQDTAPLKGFGVYVVGFHCAKDEPDNQMEAHHYCRVVNDDLLQCVLFDGNTRDANLIGIEYIVSERGTPGTPAATMASPVIGCPWAIPS